MVFSFVLLTIRVRFDAFLNFLDHAEPPKLLLYEFRYFIYAKVSHNLGVMFGLEYARDQLSRYFQADLIVEYFILQGQVLEWLNIIGAACVCGKASKTGFVLLFQYCSFTDFL